MKVTRFLALSLVCMFALTTAADARPRPQGFGGKEFTANKTFGLGLELGTPSGLNGKYFLSPDNALNFGLGYVYRHYYACDGLHLYLDYLWHPFVLTSADAFELPFYVGVGGRFWNFDYGCDRNDRNCVYDASAFGVRIPLGLSFDFNRVPLDIFVQLTPTFDFYRGYRDRDFYLGFDFSIGARFWFN